jgi:hypothetical protein
MAGDHPEIVLYMKTAGLLAPNGNDVVDLKLCTATRENLCNAVKHFDRFRVGPCRSCALYCWLVQPPRCKLLGYSLGVCFSAMLAGALWIRKLPSPRTLKQLVPHQLVPSTVVLGAATAALRLIAIRRHRVLGKASDGERLATDFAGLHHAWLDSINHRPEHALSMRTIQPSLRRTAVFQNWQPT